MTDAEHAAVLRRWMDGPGLEFPSYLAAIERAIELLEREAVPDRPPNAHNDPRW